ncbi:MAG: hypothetical protein LC689_01010 [Myxococcales bacterium]|nr:hypothetical protein [Myxococcales bacterium]
MLQDFLHHLLLGDVREHDAAAAAGQRSTSSRKTRSEHGRAGLAQHRYDFCKLLWRLWCPTWRFDEATYARTAASFDNPDFVDVVIHSYRHRFGLAPGDPSVEDSERRLAALPSITVPTTVLHGHDNGVAPAATSERHERRENASPAGSCSFLAQGWELSNALSLSSWRGVATSGRKASDGSARQRDLRPCA